MRSPLDVLKGRVGGFANIEIARRTVPCYKYVDETDGERPAVCLLVDSGSLYRFPFESFNGTRSLEAKARYLRGEIEEFRLREFMPGHCRYVKQLPPSPVLDSLTLRRSSALLALYSEPNAWIKRRRDVAEILDEVAVQWTRTIEFEIPNVDELAGIPLQLSELPIPLALHSKQVVTVLVAIPAALAALLLREARHRLTVKLASQARLSILLTSVALTLGAVAIAAHFPDSPPFLAQYDIGFRGLIWCLATLLSVFVATWTLFRQFRW